MKKYLISYKAMIFLYAYTRQVDLSLDRCRWTSWKELQDYYKSNLSPEKVMALLSKNIKTNYFDKGVFYDLKKLSLLQKIKIVLCRNLLIKCYLYESEIVYLYRILSNFQTALDSDIEKYTIELEKLRVDFAIINNSYLAYRLSFKDENRTSRIEHYLQNPVLNVVKMEAFTKDLEL